MAKITNEMRYKTAEERVRAFFEGWRNYKSSVATVIAMDFAHWLALEAEEEKPENCPFCGGETGPRHLAGGFCVECDCGYTSPFAETESNAIAAHNRVARAVRAAKKGEVK